MCLTWLHCSTGESQWLQYFKLVFLKIQNVPLRMVFANPVTYSSQFDLQFIVVTCIAPNTTLRLQIFTLSLQLLTDFPNLEYLLLILFEIMKVRTFIYIAR